MVNQKVEGVNAAKRYVIISDTHFGEEEAILLKEKEVEDFFEKLKKYGAINEFILLGDIFEFGTATSEQAISDSRAFFVSLEKFKEDQKEEYSIEMKVILMIGNHDHYIISECRKDVSNSNSNDFKSSLVFSSNQFSKVFNNIFGSSPETERLKDVIDEIRYPEYVIQLNKSKKRILLRHGHHTDKAQTGLASINAKWKKLITGKYAEKDFEAGMSVYYSFVFYPSDKVVATSKGVFWKLKLRYYDHLRTSNKIKNNRWISSREEVEEAIDLLARYYYNKMLDENNKVKFDYFDYFILGHTHNACFCNYEMTDFDFNEAFLHFEIGRKRKINRVLNQIKSKIFGTKRNYEAASKKAMKEKNQRYYEFNVGIINSGGWLDYKHDFETTRNYIVIDEDQIMLCSVGRSEPIKRVMLNKK